MNNLKKNKVIIACGGTGGHVFPGVAIAQAFQQISQATELVFVGTKRGLESQVIAELKQRLVCLDAISLKDRGLLGRISAYAFLPVALLKARQILKKEEPELVIGVGGYAAGPLCLMAVLMKIPTAIVEPNAIAGFSNRWLGHFVKRVYTGFAEVGELFSRQKVLLTGNPVRQEIVELRDKQNISKDVLHIFCFGGSQGAKAINKALVEALPYLANAKKKIKFVHQAGKKDDLDKIRVAYKNNGFEAQVFEFSDEIWKLYAQADLVIGRSGATTTAEISVIGLPAILIPYPFAADNHQQANALNLERCGGIRMIMQDKLNGKVLAEYISKLGPDKLMVMRSALLKCGKPDAAERIVLDSLRLMRS